MRRSVIGLSCAAILISSVATASPAWAADPVEQQEPIPAAQAESTPEDRTGLFEEAENTRSVQLSLAKGKGKAKDDHGFMKSLYRGKWYMPKKERVRRCIIDRESNFDYKAVSRGGTYRGAYQFNRPLAIGATWMMQPEVRKVMGAEGVAILRKLRTIPTQQWNRYWQDMAYWVVWRKGDGRRHWGTGGARCARRFG
jgi:hypothetical protein